MFESKAGLVLAVAMVFCSAAPAEEMVENAMYANWSKFKVGTSVKLTITKETEKGESKEQTVMTLKLVEILDDKVVISTSYLVKDAESKFALPAANQDVMRFVALPAKMTRKDYEKCPFGKTLEEGVESLKVGGSEYKCRWCRVKAEDNSEGKIWTSDDVPGLIVKMEGKKPGDPAKNKMELTEIKKP